MQRERKFFFRKGSAIRISRDIYNLLMVSLSRESQILQRSLTDIRQDISTAATYIRSYCASTIALHRNLLDEDQSPGTEPHCQIDPRLHKKTLENTRKYYTAKECKAADRMLKARIAECGNYWSYPSKWVNCSKRAVDEDFSNISLCFGTMDLLCLVPSSSLFWSNTLRKLIADRPYVENLLNIPMQRIKYKGSYLSLRMPPHVDQMRDEAEICGKSNQDVQHFILYTLLHPISSIRGSAYYKEKDLSTSKAALSRKEFIEKVVDYFLPKEEKGAAQNAKAINSLKKNELMRIHPNFEIFTTFSSVFPIVVKSEFLDLESASKFLHLISQECTYIGQTSSIIGWYDPGLLQRHKVPIKAIANKKSSGCKFQVLVKLSHARTLTNSKPGELPEAIQSLKEKLEDILQITPIEIFGRSSYWDYTLLVDTERVTELLDFLIHIRDHFSGDIEASILDTFEHIATIPLWPENEITDRGQKLPAVIKKKERLKQDSNTIRKNAERIKFIWESSYESIYLFNRFPIRGSQSTLGAKAIESSTFLTTPSENILNSAWFQLLEQYRWLYAYVTQMKKSWEGHPVGSKGGGGSIEMPKTFDQIQEHVHQKIQEMITFSQQLWLFDRAYPRFSDKGFPFPKGQILLEQRKLINEKWKRYSINKQVLFELMRIIRRITSEYNDRVIAHQVFSVAEHFAHIGEHSGVMDLVADAAARLFRYYCSMPNEFSKVWTDEEKENFRWQGIAVSIVDSDHKVIPSLSVLYLPVNLKFHGAGSLMPIAHEAAHQTLYWVSQTREKEQAGKLFQIKKIIGASRESAFDSFVSIWGAFLTKANDLARNINVTELQIDQDQDLFQINLNNRSPRAAIWKIEFLVDILALLSAGPAFLRSFMHYSYCPSLELPLPAEHPPYWLRFEYLRKICQVLGWFQPKDTFEINAMVLSHFEAYEDWKDINLAECAITGQWLELAVHLKRCNRLPKEFYLYLAMLQEEDDDESFIWELVRWLQLNGKNFLYYPFPIPHRKAASAPDEFRKAKLIYRQLVPYIDQKVGIISDRMCYNDEIVGDAPLKYIAAAGSLPEVKHAHYNLGRLIQSLYYSESRDAEFLRQVQNDLHIEMLKGEVPKSGEYV